jgi:hypothetical protein
MLFLEHKTKYHFYPFRRDSSLGFPAVASIKLCHQFCRGIIYPFFLFKLIPHSATDCFFSRNPSPHPVSAYLSRPSWFTPFFLQPTNSQSVSHKTSHPFFNVSLTLFLSRLPASILLMLPAVLDHLSFYPRTSIHNLKLSV